MATQGIVSVVRDGKVLLKAVAGCDGYNASKVAEYLRLSHEMAESADGMKLACNAFGFGCPNCLVIQADGNVMFRESPGGLFDDRQKYDDPRFNPRWEFGTADYVEIVEL